MPLVQVKVRPNSRQSALEAQNDGSFIATLKSAPVEGKANAELIGLLAKHFGVPRSAVAIKSGAAARMKRVVVTLPLD